MSYLSRESRGWERAWAVLGAAHGGDTEGLENGERWQYMGPAEGPAAEHCFRHRCHKGERVYFTVPVAVGDFEPATRTPLPIVGDDCAADKTIAAVRAELAAVGITYTNGARPHVTVGRFAFSRCWRYWSVEGVPLAVAKELYAHPHGCRDVRVNGDCGALDPADKTADYGDGPVVDSYDIDTVEGLRLFVATLRTHGLLPAPAPLAGPAGRLYTARPVALADIVLAEIRFRSTGSTLGEIGGAVRGMAQARGMPVPSDWDIAAAIGCLEARGDLTSALAPAAGGT